jgi:hypothetical protein
MSNKGWPKARQVRSLYDRALAQTFDPLSKLLLIRSLEKQQKSCGDQRQDGAPNDGQHEKLVVGHGARLRRIS